MYKNKFIITVIIGIYLIAAACDLSFAEELVFNKKYPDYSYIYLGNDKFEKFNRKMFNFNMRLNKYALRPIHILWASVMPKYGMDRITGVTKNIEYPIRLMSTLIQRDFPAAKTETLRFITNTTIGLCGMFDPAATIFKIEAVQEDMEQALAKCKVKRGCYLVMPVISSVTPRDIFGRILDAAFNPSSYIASPAIAAVKAAITVNRTYYMQPIVKMLESTYADPYDIVRKLYGIENYIKCANLDRINAVLSMENSENKLKNDNLQEPCENLISREDKKIKIENPEQIIDTKTNPADMLMGNAEKTDIIMKKYSSDFLFENFKLTPDIILKGYNPQTPVIDSMRTALFDISGMDSRIWADFSLWNRGFYKRLKISSINLVQNRADYKFRYLLQKNKNAPVAVIYPSIGEGIMSMHSAMLAKIFFDEGYSVVILGSHFQWEFVKSMPEEYRPGIPAVDADYVKMTTDKILSALSEKYNCKFDHKTVIGTSFGAMTTLFIGQKEFNPNVENRSKYIAVCPPIDLFHAMKQIDKNSEDWDKNTDNLKEKAALTAAKIIKVTQMKNSPEYDDNNITLPFSDEEAKLITGFILHQKLSDLIYTIENTKNVSDIYSKINNMNYSDYAIKYLTDNKYKNKDELLNKTNLYCISDYLKNSDNYKIFHSLDDYLTDTKQLKRLKMYSGTKTVLFDHGAHLGFLYRPEFLKELKKEISKNKNDV